MTKTTIFGQTEQEKSEKKQIELVKWLNNFAMDDEWSPQQKWKNITLLQKRYSITEMDLMWAYNDNPNDGVLYLGHWNDGVV